MKPIQRLLYGKFPRRVGVPHQWTVFSEAEFDVYMEHVNGQRNVYSTISWRPIQGDTYLDKVVYDLDSTAKRDGEEGWNIFGEEHPSDDEVIHRMRTDRDVAEVILGDVVEDARKIARLCDEYKIPTVGVFSGFGIHVHQLFQDKPNASTEIASTHRKFVDEASLRTYDHKIVGDVERLMRVPNCERVNDDGDSCGFVLVPLTCDEMKEITVDELLEWSYDERIIDPDLPPRKEMVVHPEYTKDNSKPSVTMEQREQAESVEVSGILEYVLKKMLKMPCMYERITTRNPSHEVRLNCAVLLFNLGLSVGDVQSIYSRLGWFDYDPEITREQLQHIYKTGYSDMSCSTLRAKGLCTRIDDPTECPTYQWSGGQPEWRQTGEDKKPWFKERDSDG